MNILSIFLGAFGGMEFLLIALVVLLLFGGKKIPELMRGLGKGMGEFKKAREEATREDANVTSTDETIVKDPKLQ